MSIEPFNLVPRHVLGGKGYVAPSDELTKAVIGAGIMGRKHFNYTGSRLVAVCDVDRNHLRQAQDLVGQGLQTFTDYREMLQLPGIDIVHIATPPHWHGIMAVEAARAGKDIWCEKPMTRTIGEGLRVIEAVQQHQRIFRLNTWFRFEGNFYGMGCPVKPIKKLVESGLLGWPLKVTLGPHTGFDWKFYWVGKTDLEPAPVPEDFDYDMWLGPAPFKPYHPHRVKGSFRGYWDYDGGGLSDMGQHYLDPIQYLLGKDDTNPVLVEVEASEQDTEAVGVWKRVEYTYADGCKIILDGAGTDLGVPFLEGPYGCLYPGFHSDIPDLENKLTGFPDPAPQITDFAEAVRTRQKFALNEENGHRSCNLVNMALIALKLGRTLRFDPVQQEFIGDEEADKQIHQPMRAPWII